jgi:hypothetical protein
MSPAFSSGTVVGVLPHHHQAAEPFVDVTGGSARRPEVSVPCRRGTADAPAGDPTVFHTNVAIGACSTPAASFGVASMARNAGGAS